MKDKTTYAILIVLVIIVLAYFAWRACYLNGVLPSKLDNPKCATSADHFRGAYGRSPAMQNCLLPQYKYDCHTGQLVADWRTPFNACMHV